MKNIFLIFSITLLLTSCRKSTFVADQTNNLLPEYSESGRNIAGALINDTAWRCEMHPCFTCYIWRFFIGSSLSGDSTTFRFEGAYSSKTIQFVDTANNNIGAAFKFVIKGLKIENQDSLLKLNNRTFQLDSINNYASISKFFPNDYGHKGKGTFTVTRVQKGNQEYGAGTPSNPAIYKFIISGRFNFQTYDDRLYDVKDGRFDMEVYWQSNLSIN
ncbi:MAG: hypothetical protein J0I09_00060 [Sphingobacteriia bacterium]|nr:hypothetical protein [Sphingobacteriia bacterium]